MPVPRVLIFTTAYKPLIGGSELALEEIAKRLPDVFFDIITAQYGDAPAYESRDNVAIHRIGSKWSLPLLGAIQGLKLAQEHSYATFHAFQASYGAVAGALLSLVKPSVPFAVTLQEGKNLPVQNIIIISRLVPKNGVDILIRALFVIRYSLFVIGDGPERKKLENLARDLGVANRVDFIGSVPNEKISEYLRRAFVFARPSRSEGLGTAFLEA